MATDSHPPPKFGAEQMPQIVASVKGSMYDEIQLSKRELVQDTEVAEERLLKGARLEKGLMFKKSHKKQFDFNT